MLRRWRITWLRFWGSLVNLSGLPGFVREGEYRSRDGVVVCVRMGPLFTTVSVRGVEVYFYRLTGSIDGVGFSPAADCRAEGSSRSSA